MRKYSWLTLLILSQGLPLSANQQYEENETGPPLTPLTLMFMYPRSWGYPDLPNHHMSIHRWGKTLLMSFMTWAPLTGRWETQKTGRYLTVHCLGNKNHTFAQTGVCLTSNSIILAEEVETRGRENKQLRNRKTFTISDVKCSLVPIYISLTLILFPWWLPEKDPDFWHKEQDFLCPWENNDKECLTHTSTKTTWITGNAWVVNTLAKFVQDILQARWCLQTVF